MECEHCGAEANFATSPEGQRCDACEEWVCDDCIDWSIDARHNHPELEVICLWCSYDLSKAKES